MTCAGAKEKSFAPFLGGSTWSNGGVLQRKKGFMLDGGGESSVQRWTFGGGGTEHRSEVALFKGKGSMCLYPQRKQQQREGRDGSRTKECTKKPLWSSLQKRGEKA